MNTNRKRLMIASFLTLIAAGIGFSIRAAILGDWSAQFGFTKQELGSITGGGLVGFGCEVPELAQLLFAEAEDGGAAHGEGDEVEEGRLALAGED